MRKIFWIMFIITVVGTVFCQESTVELATHSFDLAEAEKEINAACARNLTPVGLEVEDGQAIHILYSGIATIPFKNWFLYQHQVQYGENNGKRRVEQNYIQKLNVYYSLCSLVSHTHGDIFLVQVTQILIKPCVQVYS